MRNVNVEHIEHQTNEDIRNVVVDDEIDRVGSMDEEKLNKELMKEKDTQTSEEGKEIKIKAQGLHHKEEAAVKTNIMG